MLIFRTKMNQGACAMSELLTAAQMRTAENTATDAGQVTGLELMERAGRGVVEAVFEEWPTLAASRHKAVVLCGPGNNGGDGFVVARLLKEWGWEVEVFLYGDAAKLPPDARVNYERWLSLGTITSNKSLEGGYLSANFDLVIDAVFGTGLSRPLTEDAWLFCKEMYKAGIDVAIDVPSGFCSDSGRFLGESRSDFEGPLSVALTVTFERLRQGHALLPLAGVLRACAVKSIGIDQYLPDFRRETSVSYLSGQARIGASRKAVLNSTDQSSSHKYSHGHTLVLSGGAGRTGAARLSGRAALRIGAGLVTLGVPGSAQMEVASQVTGIMLKRVDSKEDLSGILEDERINVLCLGPGLGIERAGGLVPVAVAAGRACVLDADALSAYEGRPEALFDLVTETCILTPHGGEFARLFPDLAAKLNAPSLDGPAYSKVDATREAAARAGCVVLYKGADTVIASPDGRCSVNSALGERAAPWLATAGSGDVLAGFIAGLLARGFSPMSAAETGAWLHVECALSFGPGLIAEDLAEELPKVFKRLCS